MNVLTETYAQLSAALTTDPLNPDFSINAGEQRVRGAELEGEWQVLPHLRLTAGYARLHGRITRSNDGDEGGRLGDVPGHSLSARATWHPVSRLTLHAGVSHISERALVNGSGVDLPAVTLLDAGVGYRAARFDLDLFAANLADERYFTASGNAFAVMPGDPRSLMLRVGTHW